MVTKTKNKNWFRRHWIISIFLGLIVLGMFGSIFDSGERNESLIGKVINEPVKEESTISYENECIDYNYDSIHNIKYDFWDVETNKKIYNCLETSENIKFYDITNDDFIQKYPSVSGNYLVWEDYRNGKSDVYIYDIKNKEEHRITTHNGEDFKPIIRNDLILFHKQYDEDPLNPIPKDKKDSEYWRNDLMLYDIEKDDFIQLTNFHFQLEIVDKGSFDGEYLVTSSNAMKSLGNLLYYVGDKINKDPDRIVSIRYENGTIAKTKIKDVEPYVQWRKRNLDEIPPSFNGIMIIDDPTPPEIKMICNTNTCSIVEGDSSYIDCLYSEKLCDVDTTVFDDKVGKYFQNGYLIGDSTILNIDNGNYFTIPPYKQVKGNYVLEYELKWGLENLALIDLTKKPLFYTEDVPKEILSQFDPAINVFDICLKMHKDAYGGKVCDERAYYTRIYNFKNDKYYTIKGNLFELSSLNFDEGIYDVHNIEEFDFSDNKIIWAANNEKIINGISNQNTDIKLAVIT